MILCRVIFSCVVIYVLCLAISCESADVETLNDPSSMGSALHLEDLVKESKGYKSRKFVLNTRRALHRIPELKYEEFKTSGLVAAILTSLSIEFTDNLAGGTGIVAKLGQGSPVVGLRADMDALPIVEPEDIAQGVSFDGKSIEDFRSLHAGRMHACGHDAHTAMLLATARVLKEVESQLPGTVLLVFQPAEEGGAGAQRMLNDFPALMSVSHMFGLHLAPWLEEGTINSRIGTIMAASTTFQAVIEGVGGHAGFPHRLTDPVLAAAGCVQALQSLVSREADPSSEGVVVSVTRLSTPPGGALNVMPDDAHLGGTIRALTAHAFDRTQKRVYEVIKAQAALYGCNATVDSGGRIPYPPNVNDVAAFNMGMGIAKQVFQEDQVRVMDGPIMGAEDFAFYSQVIPSAYFMLGQGNETLKTDVGLHNRRFQVNEAIMVEGVAFQTALAVSALKAFASQQSNSPIN